MDLDPLNLEGKPSIYHHWNKENKEFHTSFQTLFFLNECCWILKNFVVVSSITTLPKESSLWWWIPDTNYRQTSSYSSFGCALICLQQINVFSFIPVSQSASYIQNTCTQSWNEAGDDDESIKVSSFLWYVSGSKFSLHNTCTDFLNFSYWAVYLTCFSYTEWIYEIGQ